MGNLLDHAKREFLRAGYTPLDQDQEEDPNKWIQENVLALIELFGSQGHSGSSAPYCINMFKRLASYKLIGPIKSAEEFDFSPEHIDMGSTKQSRVISSVFQDEEGEYYLDAVVFRNQNDSCFSGNLEKETGVKSRQYIKYPFMPKTFYIDVIDEETEPGHWETKKLKDPSQLDEVREYYDF